MGIVFELTGRPLQVMAVIAAVALPLLVVYLWSRRRPHPGNLARRVLTVAGRLLVVLLAQVTAMLALFLYVNDEYDFYASWSDLLGIQDTSPQNINVAQLNAGSGRLEKLPVRTDAGVVDDVLVWLPPGYDANTAAKYPVLEFLTGQPSSPSLLFSHFNFGTVASEAISSGRMKPFVAVLPPIMISPPRDTECVDVPHGPQASSWVTHTVPDAVLSRFHVEPMGSHWSIMGFSAGGQCAAKLLLRYPTRYGAAVALAGDYEPYTDDTTGDLFGNDKALWNENSARWLYRSYGMRGTKLLMIASKQDGWSARPTQAMAKEAHGDPHVTTIMFPVGGHNYHTYAPYLPQSLTWLTTQGAFG
ncbi:MAG: alpha/beta hydrolase-fold protein [Micropruina sp.]|uniref:alpha/beta hydrolase n=1 Tax=Micropruina sp. TaxID=2737536 RepID=UPI0039E240B3